MIAPDTPASAASSIAMSPISGIGPASASPAELARIWASGA